LEPVTTKPQSIVAETREVWVEGTGLNIRVGQGLLLRGAGGTDVFRTIVAVDIDTAHGLTCITLSAVISKDLEAGASECYLFHQRAAVFGHNAPNPCLLHIDGLNGISFDATNCEWTGDAWELSGQHLELDAAYTGIALGSLCVLVGPEVTKACRIDALSEVSLSRFALSGKVTRLELLAAPLQGARRSGGQFWLVPDLIGSIKPSVPTSYASCLNGFDRRQTSVFLQSESLKLSAIKPLPTHHRVVDRDREIRVQGPLKTLPPAGQRGVLLEADGKGGWAPREMISIQSCEEDSVAVRLTLADSLSGSYKPAQVRINLNIARATHGETVREILGNGDARIPSQRFALKQRPLTYIPAGTPAGAESTLEVRVDDLLWSARPSFIGAGPRDRVFTQRIDDDGTVILRFGDGINGARLPSGQSNVRARYRKGTGLGGLVGAKQLSLLMSRPLGVKEVLNPQAATGAEDPETLETARTTAPIRVLTLDRVVSLQDYEDYARTFPGIAKARADVHPTQPETVFVTVAGAKGASIPEGSELANRLGKALLTWGNPHLTVQVRSYRSVRFELTLKIEVRPDTLAERVADSVRATLTEAFSFERAVLGGRIWRSEVIALIQGIPGVEAVDIERFGRKTPAGILEMELRFGVSDSVLSHAVAAIAENTTKATQWLPGAPARFRLPGLRLGVPDSLLAQPADPEVGLGAELLTLHSSSLKLEIVDVL
jgi:hypothetical protein